MRHSQRHQAPWGFSIIELLIAIIIIGILVAVIVPVLLGRSEEARIRAAESDIEHLREAETRAYIDTGYLLRFYVLDDVAGGNGVFVPTDRGDVDGVRDESLNTLVVNPTQMFINRLNGLFYSATESNNIWARMSRNETNFGWEGPYINIHNLRDIDYNDLPEDPWGNDYLMFTQAGWVNMVAGTIETIFYFTPIDSVTTVGLVYPFFDRMTILSRGANGLPGDGTSTNAQFGDDDDLYQQF